MAMLCLWETNFKLTNKQAPSYHCICVSVNKVHITDILSRFVSERTNRQMKRQIISKWDSVCLH